MKNTKTLTRVALLVAIELVMKMAVSYTHLTLPTNR